MKRKSGKYVPAVTAALVAANVVLYLLQVLSPALGSWLYSRWTLVADRVRSGGEHWRLLTSVFLHASLEHLGSNMLILFFAGEQVERRLGRLPYLLLYLASGIAGNAVSVAAELSRGGRAWVSLGASGAVFGVVGAMVTLAVLGEDEGRGTLLPRVLFGVGYALYSGFRAEGTNGYAHIGGFAAGFVISGICMLLMQLSGRKGGTT